MGDGRIRRGFGVLVSGSEPAPRLSAAVLAGLRVLVGLLWLYNVVWKAQPDFGRDNGGGLYGFTRAAVEHPVFPPFGWLVEHVVLPNYLVFAWLTLIVETVLAVLLTTGTLVRLAALLGIAQGVAIGMSIAEAPNEWPWAYFMLIGIHVVLLCTWCNRYFAVDALWVPPAGAGRRRVAVSLLRVWGIVLLMVGVLALVVSVRGEVGADLGGLVGYQDLEVTVGTYNVLAAIVVLVVAAGVFGAAILGRRELAFAAAGIAILAAATLYLQLGRGDVWLGGTNTTAAVFLCAAVVGVAAGAGLGQSGPGADGGARY
ncbi:MAG TPA: hypothetical protein VIW24_00280 [Aldersonia sp.]